MALFRRSVLTPVADDLAESFGGRAHVEPFFAGRAATTEQAVAVHRAIRARVAARWKPDTAARLRILYGGSVTPQNAASLLNEPDIDGALVGGACLKTESFATIALAAKNRPVH